MSDNSTRWQRVVSQSLEKPRFQARQTTSDIPPPQRSRSRSRSAKTEDPNARVTRWWTVAVSILTVLAGLLTWLVFFA